MWSRYQSVLQFLLKGLAIYGVWYVVYDLYLLPDGRLDEWLSVNVANVTASIMGGIGFEAVVQYRSVLMEGVPGVRIINGCNGLTTIGLFIGFVVAFPGSWKHRLWFIPLGIFAIYAANVFRVIAMLGFQMYWPAAFDPMHSFGMTTFFYVVVFALWMAWVHLNEEAPISSDDNTSDDDTTTSTPAQTPALSS